MKPAPLKGVRRCEGCFFIDSDVAALKAWLESKEQQPTAIKYIDCVVISRKDWEEGWSDVND